jgi:hypothetical protein
MSAIVLQTQPDLQPTRPSTLWRCPCLPCLTSLYHALPPSSSPRLSSYCIPTPPQVSHSRALSPHKGRAFAINQLTRNCTSLWGCWMIRAVVRKCQCTVLLEPTTKGRQRQREVSGWGGRPRGIRR